MEPLILVTNDDGYNAPGLKALVEVASGYGKVVVIAPERSWSAQGHAVTLERPITIERTDYFGSDIEGYISDGTPVDCIKLGLSQVLSERPSLIVSGINHGANTSINAFYSGTVAAALEGAMNGIPSLAVSMVSFDRTADLSLARRYSSELIEFLLKQEDGLCLNVNIPDISASEAKGWRFCRQSAGVWNEEFLEWEHPVRKQKYYWLTGKFYNFEPDSKDTDLWALANGYASVVPITTDLTNYALLQKLKNLGV